MTIPPVSNELTNSLLDQMVSSVPAIQDGRPSAVILMGGVAAGKTAIRKRDYSHGYVLIDSADVFLRLCQGRHLDFPGELHIPMDYIGTLVAVKALNEKRPVVTEIIGDNKETTIALIEALKSVDYDVKMVAVTCEINEVCRRNVSRGEDNISAYYAAPFQTRWITHACQVIREHRATKESEGLPGASAEESPSRAPSGHPESRYGCNSCWPDTAEAAWAARWALTLTADLIDESHFHLMILACGKCNQLFISIFTETIDWEDGDDPQYWTQMPITGPEAINLVQQKEVLSDSQLNSLAQGRRGLRHDHPKDSASNIRWGHGIWVGPHD